MVAVDAPARERETIAAQHSAARGFFYSAVFWLLAPGMAGLVMAVLLLDARAQELIPEGARAALNFGRLRPMHVNVMLFGWLSMTYAGAALYIVPRLTATPLFSEGLARVNLLLWNVLVLGAAISLPLGYNQGREYAEMAWPLDLLFLACLVLLGINVWGTVFHRKEPRLYITVWSFMAATAIAPLVYAVGNKVWDPSGAYTGETDAIINFFYVHNIFNVWFTTGALGLFFYALPRLTGNPLFSHRLALWGFSSVWTGQHHLLYGPGPEWLEIASVAFSFLAAIGNAAFLVNFLGTMKGAWDKVLTEVPLRFLALACIFYFMTCIQGLTQSFRSFNAYIHFTNWVIGHSHLALAGAYSFLAAALIYGMLPLMGRRIYSRRLMEWHFWLVAVGLVVFMIDLWTAGLIQAQDWESPGVPFIEAVHAMKPFYLLRLLAGLVMGVGLLAFGYNVLRTALCASHPSAT